MTQDRRAAIYRRVSTERQADEGWNYEEDGRKLRELAERREYELVEEHGDAGISGVREDRPGLQAMLRSAEAGHFEVLLIPDIERLSRDFVAALGFVKQLHAAEVRVETFRGPMDLESPQGELHVNLDAAVGQFYRRQLGAKVSQAARARAAKGAAPGGRYPPTGYRRQEGRYIVHEPEAGVIRRIFTEADEGYSQHRIAQRLNADGLRTPRGKAWTQGTIGRTLRHPVYRGAIVYKKQVLAEDAHEAIIEPEWWARVQRGMAARDNAPGAARGRKPNGSHLLIGGLLRCRCGSALVPRSRSRSRPNATDTYECSGRRDHGTDFCPQGPLPRELIDGTILGRFEQIGLSVEATKRDYAEATEHQLQQARDALVQAERAERKASEALTRIRGDYKAGKLSSESWEDLKPELIEEQKAAAREVERLRAHEHDIANATALDDAEQAVLEWLTELREVIAGKVRNAESVEALRNALTRVFERFEFRPSPEGWHPPRYLVAVPREDALATKPGEWPEELHRTGICVPQVTRTG